MDFKRKKRRFLWIVRLIGAALACIAGILLGAYLGRLEIATIVTTKALEQSGFSNSELHISRLDQTNCVVEDVRLSTDSFELKIDSLHAQFNLADVWNKEGLQSLRISGVTLRYDLTGPSTFDPQELDALIKNGIPFPLDSLDMEEATIELLTDIGEISFNTELSLSKIGVSEIQGTIKGLSELESMEMDIRIADQIDFTATASSTNLMSSLATYNFQLNKILDLKPNSSIDLSSGSIKAQGAFIGIEPQPINIELELGPGRYDESSIAIEIDSIDSTLVFDSNDIRNIASNIHLKQAHLATYEIQESIIQISAPSLQSISIKVPKTHWQSTNDDHGVISADIEAQLNEDFTPDSVTILGKSHELVTNAVELAPFQLSLIGTLEKAILTTSKLATKSHPWIQLDALNISLENLVTDNPSIEFSSKLEATAENSLDPEPPVTGSWKLIGSIEPNAQPQVANLSIQSLEEHPLVSTPSYVLNGNGNLDIKARHWAEENLAAVEVAFNVTNLNAQLPSIAFQGISLNATLSSKPIAIPDIISNKDNLDSLIYQIAKSTEHKVDFQGAEFAIPDTASMQWFSGSLESDHSDSQLQTKLTLGIGIANIGAESVQQISIESKLSIDSREANAKTTGALLFEGETLSIQSNQSFDFSEPTFSSQGEYSISGIHLESSDILSRYAPSLNETIVSADLEIDGSIKLESDQLETPAVLKLSDGSILYPAEDVLIDSIQTNIEFKSIANQITRPSQVLNIKALSFGDIEAKDLLLHFEVDESNQLHVEKAQMHSFDGTLALDPFTIDLDDPQTAITLRFKQISIAPVMTMLNFFEGESTGRLDGVLPITIVDGLPVLGEGYLQLDPESDAQFAYDAQGYFTQTGDPNAPKKAFADKMLERLGLEPNALLEDALGNLNIHELRMDLFSKDLPGTPMRIQLAGLADTGTAQIPANITTNVNGTVAELLNFLMRLNSLGLVPETE